jgi:hypothetical protein
MKSIEIPIPNIMSGGGRKCFRDQKPTAKIRCESNAVRASRIRDIAHKRAEVGVQDHDVTSMRNAHAPSVDRKVIPAL